MPELRIATFDNDGTLWCEQRFYFQLAFVHHGDAEREYAYDRNSLIGQARQGAGRSEKARLDRGRHEGRLENDLSESIVPRPVDIGPPSNSISPIALSRLEASQLASVTGRKREWPCQNFSHNYWH
jgi:hypothetical protein